MKENKIRLIISAIVVIIATAILYCNAADSGTNETEQSGFREIPIVTVTPKYHREEQVNFDLRNLSIVGRDNPNDTDRDGSDDIGEDVARDTAEAEPVTGEDSDISGEHRFEDAGDVGIDETAESVGSGDWDDNIPDNGYAGRPEDEGTLPELVGAEASDETGSEGSVDEYAGDAEAGSGDGYSDETEDGEQDLTYLGTFTATAYCACPECTGIYSSGYTASGTWATEGRTIACNILPFGTQVYIEGYGYYVVEDTGWSPYGDNWLDFFFDSHDSALAFGLRQVEVYLVN